MATIRSILLGQVALYSGDKLVHHVGTVWLIFQGQAGPEPGLMLFHSLEVDLSPLFLCLSANL